MTLLRLPDQIIDVDASLRELDRMDMEESLYTFLRNAWRYIDPAPWTDGWVMEAVAEHLEAVCDGQIRRLIVNIPPRCAKSSLISVAFPAWVWAQRYDGPTSGPSVPFLHASYDMRLSLRDSVKCRRLIESPFYQTYWGHRVQFAADQNQKTRFQNTAGGERLITSIGAGVTGEGGNCFVVGTMVSTPSGPRPIQQICEGDEVFGFDIRRGRVVKSVVVATQSRKTDALYEVHTSAGTRFVCTGDHPIYSPGRGYIRASELGNGDRLLVERGADCSHPSSMRRVRQGCPQEVVRGPQGVGAGKPRQLLQQAMLFGASRCQEFYAALRGMWCAGKEQARALLLRCMQASGACWASKEERVPALRRAILWLDDVLQAGLCRCSAFRTHAGRAQFAVHGDRSLFQSVYGTKAVHSGAGQRGLSRLWRIGQASAAQERAHSELPTYSSHRQQQSEQRSNKSDYTVRELSSEPPSWEIGHVVSVARVGGPAQRVYDIQVAFTNNFFAAGVLAHNCIIIDDPNSASEAFSEATIEATKDWWDSTMSTRHNDPKTGAFVIVQQRLAEDDLTGHILSKNAGEWTHLVLPMRYERDRSFVTAIGWQDPREEEGELLWPERFGEDEVAGLERALGPFACNPTEAPILMADLTMKPIGNIVIGDQIVGFEKREAVGNASHGRFKLTKAEVLAVHKRRAPVVKINLEHGEVIRCTPDHKWFTKDRGPGREMYMPATLRSRLARVCPADLRKLNEEDARDAGWLSGFFDGEGTVSSCTREGYEPSSVIQFYQGSGRNAPLCEKLERLLTKFGFEYSYSEDERKPNKDAPCYGYRSYRIKCDGIRTMQRFLHIVQPTKWRNRIIDGAFRSNFIQRREKVLSIEPDGEDVVYALTTTTGNYIVWGLASSNSAGQLQQRPEVKGGGVVPRDTWQLWPEDSYPPFDYIIASLDTAYTLKQENDYSALTVWGVFSGDYKAQATHSAGVRGRMEVIEREYEQGSPRVMLMNAWQERLELHALVKKVADTCKAMKVDKLLIENKAAGISVAQEIRRLFGHDQWGVQLVDPKAQDKLARLYSVQHLFFEGMVYAPDRSWADMVITQVAVFPKGRNDDLVDTCSQALQHLRTIGMLQRAPERLAEMDEERSRPMGADVPLYPV
jgi:predicted phage terminase large subunit-like protein